MVNVNKKLSVNKQNKKQEKPAVQMLYVMQMACDSANPSGQYAWITGRSSKGQHNGVGTWKDALVALDCRLPVVLVLPASEGLQAWVDIPSNNHARRRAALPFKLRHEVVGDINNWYLAWISRKGESSLKVAGFPKILLNPLLQACGDGGLHIQNIVLDTQLLPETSGSWNLFIHTNFCLLNDGHGGSYRITALFVEAIQGQIIRTNGEPDSITVHGACDEAESQKWITDAVQSLPLSIGSNANLEIIDFLQDCYGTTEAVSLLPTNSALGTLTERLISGFRQTGIWMGFLLIVCLAWLFLDMAKLNNQLSEKKIQYQSLAQELAQQLGSNNSTAAINDQLFLRLEDLLNIENQSTQSPLIGLIHLWGSMQAQYDLLQDGEVLAVEFSTPILQIYWQSANAEAVNKLINKVLGAPEYVQIEPIDGGPQWQALGNKLVSGQKLFGLQFTQLKEGADNDH